MVDLDVERLRTGKVGARNYVVTIDDCYEHAEVSKPFSAHSPAPQLNYMANVFVHRRCKEELSTLARPCSH